MAYIYDEDLEFLGKLESKDLDALVYCLTHAKDGEKLLMESLTQSINYIRHYPDHLKYWEETAGELQYFGSNDIMYKLKGNKGVLYREILCDVCDKLKVNYNKKSEISLIEQNLLLSVLQQSIEKMTTEELKELATDLGLENIEGVKGQAIMAVCQAMFKAGGFKSYQITVIVANAVMRALFGKGLAFAGNQMLLKAANVLAGPVGWFITAIWTALDLAGPAYRVTIPAVIQVAYLRILLANKPTLAGLSKNSEN